MINRFIKWWKSPPNPVHAYSDYLDAVSYSVLEGRLDNETGSLYSGFLADYFSEHQSVPPFGIRQGIKSEEFLGWCRDENNRRKRMLCLPEGMKYEPINSFPIPMSLNWLGEDGGKEDHGCVLYFEDKTQCLEFIKMMCELAQQEVT